MTEEIERRAADDRYASIDRLWASVAIPPITRVEAEKAARALYRKFGRKAEYPAQRFDAKLDRVRSCWINLKGGSRTDRGWARLVHDVSHRIFDKRYPKFRPHHPLHARLEHEISVFVVGGDWLSGGLRPKPVNKDPGAARAREIEKLDASLARWDSKLRRAQNAIKRISAKRKRLLRAHGNAAPD